MGRTEYIWNWAQARLRFSICQFWSNLKKTIWNDKKITPHYFSNGIRPPLLHIKYEVHDNWGIQHWIIKKQIYYSVSSTLYLFQPPLLSGVSPDGICWCSRWPCDPATPSSCVSPMGLPGGHSWVSWAKNEHLIGLVDLLATGRPSAAYLGHVQPRAI